MQERHRHRLARSRVIGEVSASRPLETTPTKKSFVSASILRSAHAPERTMNRFFYLAEIGTL